jgi:Zn-dependent peptidase ImmA (M78 family)
MPDIINSSDKDAVLSAFLEACPSPLPKEIAEWRARYPHFAADIMELAADLIFLQNERVDSLPGLTPESGDEAFSVAIRSLRAAEQRLQERRAAADRGQAIVVDLDVLSDPERRGVERDWQYTFGARLKFAREGRGLNEQDVLNALGLERGPEFLRELEDNTVYPDDELVVALSRALGVSKGYLLNRRGRYLIDVSPRNGHRLSDEELRWIEVQAINYAEECLELEEKFGEIVGALGSTSIRTEEEAEKAASDVRSIWRLGDEPILSLTSELENRGTKVLLVEMGDGDGFAMRISEGDRPKTQVIVVGQRWPMGRRRFTLAHELAHLLDPHVSETMADHFAGALLLPMEVVRGRFRNADEVTIQALIPLKEEYGISLQAIAYRCRIAGLIDDQQLVALFKTFRSSDPAYGKASLEDFTEMPRRYRELRRKALALGLIE